MHTLPRSTLSLGLAAGCAAALSFPHVPEARATAGTRAPAEDAVALRAQGPAALEALLARWDRMSPGAERDQLARTIDTVAAQRYATTSRLYWYTDLASAQRAARTRQRPILALRMLGRLDEDLSCANSRLFRSTLYANAEVSQFLREHFVLYWSSERPVPLVTIDYGDGRKLERTTTGNSAHYVLDEAGGVIDALPGLYAPSVFRTELAKSYSLAQSLRRVPDAQRRQLLAKHHTAQRLAASQRFGAVAGTTYVRGRGRLLSAGELGSQVARAQGATMAKAIIEVRDLGKLGINAGSISRDDVAAWAFVGQKLWELVASSSAAGPYGRAPGQAAKPGPGAPRRAVGVLDARSRALVEQLHDGGALRSTPAERARMIARLEQSIVADTALNELVLRPAIRGALASAEASSLERLNAWVYEHVFHTPRTDAWLGLLPRTDFTGLPGDGVVMP